MLHSIITWLEMNDPQKQEKGGVKTVFNHKQAVHCIKHQRCFFIYNITIFPQTVYY